MRYIAIIPAYNPGEAVNEVIRNTLFLVDHVVVVNDGSEPEQERWLRLYRQEERVTVIDHKVNLGKGHALWTGFREALKREFDYLLTIDADGQHRPEEISRFKQGLAGELAGFDLVVGQRSVGGEMPWRSRVGNRLTAGLSRYVLGVAVEDTQSGFRALKREWVERVVREIDPGRYETEMRVLVKAWQEGRRVGYVPISTVYFERNRNSKFKPIRDSLKVLGEFMRFTGVSFTAWLIDYLAFLGLNVLLPIHFTAANVISKGLSMIYYFWLNRRMVFYSTGGVRGEIGRYLLLAMLNVGVATGLLYVLARAGLTEYAAKPMADMIMFGFNFWAMKWLVYKQLGRRSRNKND